MRSSHDPEVQKLIQTSRDAVATTRQMIAQSARVRADLRATIRETRRLIDAARADMAGRER